MTEILSIIGAVLSVGVLLTMVLITMYACCIVSKEADDKAGKVFDKYNNNESGE